MIFATLATLSACLALPSNNTTTYRTGVCKNIKPNEDCAKVSFWKLEGTMIPIAASVPKIDDCKCSRTVYWPGKTFEAFHGMTICIRNNDVISFETPEYKESFQTFHQDGLIPRLVG